MGVWRRVYRFRVPTLWDDEEKCASTLGRNEPWKNSTNRTSINLINPIPIRNRRNHRVRQVPQARQVRHNHLARRRIVLSGNAEAVVGELARATRV